MRRTGAVVGGGCGGALAWALCLALASGAARGDEPPPARTLREALEPGRVAPGDEALVELVRAEGDAALPLVGALIDEADDADHDDPGRRALRARVLRALPRALGRQGELVLVGVAGSRRPRAVRVDALAALADVGGHGAIPGLLARLDEPDEAVRGEAIVALASVVARGPHALRTTVVGALRALIGAAWRGGATAAEVDRARGALAALCVLLRAEAVQDLVAALAQPHVELRAAALAVLARSDADEVATDRAAVRVALLRSLRAAPPRRPGELDEKGLALAAVPAWGEPSTCVLPILEAIEADPSCREPGLAALRRLVGRDVGDVPAWWQLWARGGPSWPGLDVLLATLEAGDTDAVVRALDALRDVPDPRTFLAIERLVQRLDAGHAWALGWADAQAIAACRALGALRDLRGVPALLVVLAGRGASDRARGEAHQALVRITGRAGPLQADAWRACLPDGLTTPLSSRRRDRRGDAAPWRAALAALPVVAMPPPVDERTPLAGLAGAVAWAAAPSRDGRGRAALALLALAGALVTASGVWLAMRRRRSADPDPDAAPSQDAAGDAVKDASSAAALALRSLEDVTVPALRRGPSERRRFTAPPTFDAQGRSLPRADQDEDLAREADDGDGDGVVHVVLRSSPRPAAPAPAAPEAGDPVWREALAGLDELAPSVTRLWARIDEPDGWQEQVVYDASDGRRTLRDAVAALPAGGQVEALEVELGGGARLTLYERAREAPPPRADDPRWRDLLAAVAEMGASVDAVWARMEGQAQAETLWTREHPGGLAAVPGALAAVRARVERAGVRLVGSAAELVLFDDRAAAPAAPAAPGVRAPAREHEAGLAGTLEALRAMGGAVRGLSARLSIDATWAGPRRLFPTDECRALDDALVALEGLEPLVIDVRARLAGAEADLVLLDRAAPSAPAVVGLAGPAGADAWEELVGAIEELGPQLQHVLVRGGDGEDLVVFADDEGGIPSLVNGLRCLDGLVVHVRVRLVGSATELVLLDRPVAPRRGATFRELMGGASRSSVTRCVAA